MWCIFQGETSTSQECFRFVVQLSICFFPPIWTCCLGLTYNSYIKPIFTLLKEAVRAIAIENHCAPSSSILPALQLLKLQDLFELKFLSFVYESVSKMSLSCFHGFFGLLYNVHQYHSRQASRSGIFLTRRFTLEYGLKSVRCVGATSWKSIPILIKQAVSISSTRRQAKLHLFFINLNNVCFSNK